MRNSSHCRPKDTGDWMTGKLKSFRQSITAAQTRILSGSSACPTRVKFLALCLIVFFIALGIRLLHWQDIHVEIEDGQSLLTDLIEAYRYEARRITEDGDYLFAHKPAEPTDARLIVHPPGYAILIATLSKLSDDPAWSLRLFQIIADSAAAVLVLLIAAKLLPLITAFVASLIVAFSPHLAFYSLWLTPDSLAVLPILIAVYLIIKTREQPRIFLTIAAGLMLGISCWLRSNALLLAPFLAIVFFALLNRGNRLRHLLALVAAALITISPITVRNWIVYDRFIPLSLGPGITLVEGIADYDYEGRFRMPRDDKETAIKDAEWHNRPDYAGNLWLPDGVERDRYRFARGIEVIRSNPGWFSGVMLRRAGFMLRYNDDGPSQWPFGTAKVPTLSSEPPFGHNITAINPSQTFMSNTPVQLVATGKALSPETEIAITDNGNALQVTGDDSEFGDQFVSAPLAVQKNTDYVLSLAVELAQGNMAVKITSADRRISLASDILRPKGRGKTDKKKLKQQESEDEAMKQNDDSLAQMLRLPFASGNRTEVCLVLSNNGSSPQPPDVRLGDMELTGYGLTPFLWTRPVRAIIRGAQKNLYRTSFLLPIILIGIFLLALARKWHPLAILIGVPLYYLSIQSVFHTEYRYILGIHYFLFIFAAVTIYSLAIWIGLGARWTKSKLAALARG